MKDGHHLDGDEQQYLQHYSEAVHLYDQADDLKCKDGSAPAELWMPYLTHICDQVVNIKKKMSSHMVITRAFHDKEQAQFVRDWLEKKGISLVFIELQISDTEFVERFKLRHRKKAVINKLPMEEYWEKRNRNYKWKDFNDENEEAFIRDLMIGWDDSLAGMDDCFLIDASLGFQHLVGEIGDICDIPVVENIDTEATAEINIMRGKKYRECIGSSFLF